MSKYGLILDREEGENIIIDGSIVVSVIVLDYDVVTISVSNVGLCSLKAGETLDIRDDIRLTVIDWDDDEVSIGIKAPKDIQVDREEVHFKKLESKNGSN